MEKRTDATAIRPGTMLSRISYMQVVGANPRRKTLTVRNQEGLQWDISENIIENEAFSADQFEETVKVSRTEMVEALENAGDSVFTIVFNKKVSEKAVREAIGLLADSADFSAKAIKATAKELLVGEERTLIGHMASTEPKMGRSQVVDLEKAPGTHRLRLVDHRTIKQLILRNVQYVLK